MGLVERLEVGLGQVHLAAHLHGASRADEYVGHVGDGADVVGDVLAHAAVAPGGGLDELAVAVGDRQREAVDLGLDREHRHVGVE